MVAAGGRQRQEELDQMQEEQDEEDEEGSEEEEDEEGFEGEAWGHVRRWGAGPCILAARSPARRCLACPPPA